MHRGERFPVASTELRSRSLLSIGLCVALVLGCAPSASGPAQMVTAGLDFEVQLSAAKAWEPLAPPLVVRTEQASKITALFVGECKPRVVVRDILVSPVDGSPQTVSVPVGRPIQVRIRVDDELAFPPHSHLCGTALDYESHSFLATSEELPAGTHRVVVEWRSSLEGALMRSRTLTAWEQPL